MGISIFEHTLHYTNQIYSYLNNFMGCRLFRGGVIVLVAPAMKSDTLTCLNSTCLNCLNMNLKKNVWNTALWYMLPYQFLEQIQYFLL